MKYFYICCFAISLGSVSADHGPLTTGAGATLIEPNTLKRRTLALGQAIIGNSYERFSDAQLKELTQKAGGLGTHVDAIRQSLMAVTTIAYGLRDSVEAGFRFRYYRGENIREGLIDSGGTYRQLDLGTVAGIADPDFSLKWRVLKDETHSFAVLAAVKAPLGKYYAVDESQPLSTYASNSRNPSFHLVGAASGDPLAQKYSYEPSLTPGSGAWDYSGAAAYSRWIAEGVSLSSSVLFTRRSESQNYKIGDSLDWGVSLQKRWGGRDEANFSLFAEFAMRHQARAESSGTTITNTGGTVAFVSPGMIVAWPSGLAISCFFQVPFLRYLNEPQQNLLYRMGFSLSYVIDFGRND